jgi:hypothetical protein
MKSKKDKTNMFIEKALDKMFQAVGFNKWDKEFTDTNKDWYSQKTWTSSQVEEYKKWFIIEIKKDLKLNKIQAEKEWSWFFLMWGWKAEQEQAVP